MPSQWYQASSRAYPCREPVVEYPGHFEVRRVRRSGEIKWAGGLLYVSEALIGEPVGLEAVSEDHWKLCFGPIELGMVDARTGKLLAYTRRARRARGVRAGVDHSRRPPGSSRAPHPSDTEPS